MDRQFEELVWGFMEADRLTTSFDVDLSDDDAVFEAAERLKERHPEIEHACIFDVALAVRSEISREAAQPADGGK